MVLDYRLGKVIAVGQILSWSAKITKQDPRRPNTLVFSTLKSDVPVLNDEVSYYDLDNNQVFGGYIQNIKDAEGVNLITLGDYSIKLSQDKVSEVYEGMSPEAIVEDIINNHTELTYVSSVTTGINIEKIVFRDEWQIDAINKLLELFDGNYEVDLDKNFTVTINASELSGVDILRGRDSLQGSWSNDIGKKAEKVIVLGAIVDQRTTETIVGTGTIFNTTYKPENVEITGLQQTTSDLTGDYEVNVEGKEITFNSSKTDPVISYTYKSQIRVELGTGKTVILEKKYLESKLEARKLAISYKNRFEDGVQSSKWLKNSADINSVSVGDQIYVSDDSNNKTGTYIIKKVTLNLPNKMIIDVGETEEDLFDHQKETIERIKQLEQNNTNSDFITLYDYIINGLKVNVKLSLTTLKTITDDGTILFASETALSTDADLISDTGLDADFALAYDDDALPPGLVTDYLDATFPWTFPMTFGG